MTSIIINNFYRALLRIEEEEGFAKYTAKTLAVRLVDDLYPEDGYITVDDSPRTNKKHIWIQLGPKTMEAVLESWKDATTPEESVAEDQVMPEKAEATVPTVPEPVEEPAPAPAEVKEVKVKEVKPKLTKEQKEAEKAAKEKAKEDAKAAKEKAKAAKEKEKAEKKTAPKAKFVGNIEKLNPTQDKLFKKVAADIKVELASDAKTKFLAFLNALDNKDFNAKKLEEHMKEFLTPKVETKDEECTEVEYKGKIYWVNGSGVVYQTETLEDGSEIDKKVGQVGMAHFAEMEMPK